MEDKFYIAIISGLLAITVWGLKVIFDTVRKDIARHDEKLDKVDGRLDGHDVIIDRIITSHNIVCPNVMKIDKLETIK